MVERLNENWTPEQISGWLRHGNERGLPYICHEAIYAWIYSRRKAVDKLWKLATQAQGQTRLQTGP